MIDQVVFFVFNDLLSSSAQLNEYREYLEQKQVEQQRHTNITKLEDEAKRTHYLVSTKAVPGIYNSKYLEYKNIRCQLIDEGFVFQSTERNGNYSSYNEIPSSTTE